MIMFMFEIYVMSRRLFLAINKNVYARFDKLLLSLYSLATLINFGFSTLLAKKGAISFNSLPPECF